MKKLFLLSFVLLLTFNLSAQDILSNSDIKWQNIEQKINDNPKQKNFFAFIYSQDCPHCIKTVEETLKNKQLVQAINNQFIPIKLDAHSFETIHILNTDFTYDQKSGFHGLPIVLLEGNMALPSFVFLNSKFEVISKISGFQENVEQLTDFFNYIGQNKHSEMSWGDYYNSIHTK